MHLVQILLPLYDNTGRPLPPDLYQAVRVELSDRFGGFTAFTRAPAEGLWTGQSGMARDDIVIFEVMVPALDRSWWRGYRHSLEERFHQEEIVIRVQTIDVI